MLENFFERWGEEGRAITTWVPFVFLEYDADSHDPVCPSLFAALDSPAGKAPTRGFPELGAAQEVAQLLALEPLAPAQSDLLHACFASLTGHARVLHLAAMLGRRGKGLRISVWIDGRSATDYLERIGATEPAYQTERLFSALPSRPGFCQLDFDLGPPVAARVGLGCRPTSAGQWHRLLHHLADIGACDRDKIHGLLSWPGVDDHGSRRDLSHVKVTCDSSGTIEAKCYLGVSGSARLDD